MKSDHAEGPCGVTAPRASEEHAERVIVEETIDRCNRNRAPRIEHLDPGVELVCDFGSRTFRGYAGLRAWMADMLDSFDLWRVEVKEVRELEDARFLVVATAHMRGRGSGVRLCAPCGWLLHFRDRRITRIEVLVNRVDDARGHGAALLPE